MKEVRVRVLGRAGEGQEGDRNALADVSNLLKKAFPRGPVYTRVVLDSIH